MSAIGVQGEDVIGSKSTFAIGAGNTLDLKKIWSLEKMGQPIRDAGPSGTHWSFGEVDGEVSVDVIASTPDLSTFEGYVTKDSNGDFPEKTVVITLPPVGGGSSVTATFTCKFYRYQLLHFTEEGKVEIQFNAKLTQEDITWA